MKKGLRSQTCTLKEMMRLAKIMTKEQDLNGLSLIIDLGEVRVITLEKREHFGLGMGAIRSINNIDIETGNDSNYFTSMDRTRVTRTKKNIEGSRCNMFIKA